jgi:hypothetical protein
LIKAPTLEESSLAITARLKMEACVSRWMQHALSIMPPTLSIYKKTVTLIKKGLPMAFAD